MKQIVIAFDIDGTLRDNTVQDRLAANERIRTLLITLASMKNTTIMLWSGGGAKYARQVAAAMAIEQYVDVYEDKKYGGYDAEGHPIFHTNLKPDIAFDDIQECELGALNLVVDEKGFTPGYVPPELRRRTDSSAHIFHARTGTGSGSIGSRTATSWRFQ
jgi:hydroxymethylpyrimidine pyrophosphatase-like HAD family hydrolase